jgi:PUA domain protein
MFKTFNPKTDISGQTILKSSVQRGIRAKLIEQYPNIEQHIEEILPKKQNMVLRKW